MTGLNGILLVVISKRKYKLTILWFIYDFSTIFSKSVQEIIDETADSVHKEGPREFETVHLRVVPLELRLRQLILFRLLLWPWNHISVVIFSYKLASIHVPWTCQKSMLFWQFDGVSCDVTRTKPQTPGQGVATIILKILSNIPNCIKSNSDNGKCLLSTWRFLQIFGFSGVISTLN